MKKFMKELYKYILFWTIIFVLLMLFISFVLNSMNYQFLNWIKYALMIISLIGTLLGTIQLLKKKKVICTIICILEVILIGSFNLALIFFSFDSEEIVLKNNKKMIQETHSFLLSNWIKYYDYKNIFIRSKQERIYEVHDDYIGEYLYTIYYDKNGQVIKQEE